MKRFTDEEFGKVIFISKSLYQALAEPNLLIMSSKEKAQWKTKTTKHKQPLQINKKQIFSYIKDSIKTKLKEFVECRLHKQHIQKLINNLLNDNRGKKEEELHFLAFQLYKGESSSTSFRENYDCVGNGET